MFWVAVLLGVVEGLTEFLPISSTGHLIITAELLNFGGERAKLFEIVIQLGAILAVVWEYRARLLRIALDLPRRREAQGFVLVLILAFVPSAVTGLLLVDLIFELLFSPTTVAAALIAGALLILVVEALPLKPHTEQVEAISWKQGLWIGLAQCLALWPGFSRSAATILGGLCTGLDRKSAAEFSFFLAIPTMFGATGYNLLKHRHWLELGDMKWLALSFVVSFIVGWIAVRWLIRFISSHSFRPFAWYRIVLGVLILLLMR